MLTNIMEIVGKMRKYKLFIENYFMEVKEEIDMLPDTLRCYILMSYERCRQDSNDYHKRKVI